MPYFFFPPEEVKFPPAHFADIDGLLAQGGEISAEWLLEGYTNGVFLWADPMEPLKWWSPDPRVVLFPNQVELPPPLQATLAQDLYMFTYHEKLAECLAFCESIENKKPMYPGWLTGQFKQSYLELNAQGRVRSCLVWNHGKLVACAFGTQVGKVYFGEHVCSTSEEAAKIALVKLAQKLAAERLTMMDVHKETNLTEDIGFQEISRNEYLDLLKKGIQ